MDVQHNKRGQAYGHLLSERTKNRTLARYFVDAFPRDEAMGGMHTTNGRSLSFVCTTP